MNHTVTQSEVEYLRVMLQRETDMIEAAKLQKEIAEKEEELMRLHLMRLQEIENDGKGIIGSR